MHYDVPGARGESAGGCTGGLSTGDAARLSEPAAGGDVILVSVTGGSAVAGWAAAPGAWGGAAPHK